MKRTSPRKRPFAANQAFEQAKAAAFARRAPRDEKLPAADTSPINMSLTVTERDAIDEATRRLRGCVTILDRLTQHEDSDFNLDEPEDSAALAVLLEDMRAALDGLDRIFHALDRVVVDRLVVEGAR